MCTENPHNLRQKKSLILPLLWTTISVFKCNLLDKLVSHQWQPIHKRILSSRNSRTSPSSLRPAVNSTWKVFCGDTYLEHMVTSITVFHGFRTSSTRGKEKFSILLPNILITSSTLGSSPMKCVSLAQKTPELLNYSSTIVFHTSATTGQHFSLKE